MNLNKILGYVLLIAGLLLIIIVIYQSYNIFMAKSSAPLIFKVQAPILLPKAVGANNLQDAQKQLNEEISKQLSQLIPIDTLPKILNLLSWSILAFILIFGGSQIASLGIKMVK